MLSFEPSESCCILLFIMFVFFFIHYWLLPCVSPSAIESWNDACKVTLGGNKKRERKNKKKVASDHMPFSKKFT